MPSISWKWILASAGLCCILWSYYQLFAVRPEEALIGKTVTAATIDGEISGKAIAAYRGMIIVSRNNAVERLSEKSIIEVDNTSAFYYEARRAVVAVCLSSAGGLIVLTALFFF